ncbi:uncharacterized protein [Asterias amurensis]|uniref:uncharacterized protein n=1 Tax=Asterias amurensis TaxID=7602 RepID=UPI003AB8C718
MANAHTFLVVVVLLCAYFGGVSALTYSAGLAIVVMSMIIPGLVILTCIIGSIFLCWNRDRIPWFRSKLKARSKPDNKVQTPISPGHGYPTQRYPAQPESGPRDKAEEVEMRREPLDETDWVVAVDVNGKDTRM